MPNVTTFTVMPKLPEKLQRLDEIARNVCWCWSPMSIELFFRIDRDLWVATNQNPVQVLGNVPQQRLAELAEDEGFLAHLDRVYDRFQSYMQSGNWRERHPDAPDNFHAAYFSAEFGLQESISIYSGGLGLLAGDHLKSASDLGLPFTAVGLLYRQGYFHQYLNADGWQQERYPRNDYFNTAVYPVKTESGDDLIFDLEYPERMVKVRVWACNVGRITLYLLDTDVPENHEDDREITGQLYGGNHDMRVRQEILLGMGGVKALQHLGITPSLYHMNEGHAAFLTLQRIKDLMREKGYSLNHAAELVKASSVFTTHTPVPAGNDAFPPEMIEWFFTKYMSDVGMGAKEFLGLGRQDPNDSKEPFCMTVLAFKLSAYTNGVSKLHGEVARDMWSRAWKGVPRDEVPITSITNGVHTRFWISRDLASLYDRYVGPDWVEHPDDQSIWKRIDEIPDAELWRTHERRRERLVNFARKRLMEQLKGRGAPGSDVRLAAEVLDPEALTIGFARRFATYKRANLLLMDPERFKRLLTQTGRPIQFIMAGKAHPQDNEGKALIRNLVHFARDPEVRNRLVFIENYDINVARYMVQGVDCWLNTPRRPNEASGTSGMKAAANGALNISVPDGWWCEAEDLGENGWSIGKGEMYDDPNEQDIVESEALYEILEKEIVPMYYARGNDNLPRKWVECMKTAIRTICPEFNTNRMVQEYAERFYIPSSTRSNALSADNGARALALAEWKSTIRQNWSKINIRKVDSSDRSNLMFGSELTVTAEVELDGLTPDDVTVEVYYGLLDARRELKTGTAVEMTPGAKSGKAQKYQGVIPCDHAGQLGFTVRAVPNHSDLAQKHETALITWA